MASKDERQARTEFAQRYAVGRSGVVDAIERRVIGEAWGANGFTTVAEADVLGERLGLAPGKQLLDIGTGRGWPGLYLAKRTGCRVVLSDLPIEGLEIARRRATEERIDSLGAAVASARHLPFAERSVDGIVHSDVLC